MACRSSLRPAPKSFNEPPPAFQTAFRPGNHQKNIQKSSEIIQKHCEILQNPCEIEANRGSNMLPTFSASTEPRREINSTAFKGGQYLRT